MHPTEKPRTWLTPDAHARLTAELAELLTRHDPSGEPSAASSNDEPGDGSALVTREHQQTRIRQLRQLLQDAVVGERPADDGIAEPGMLLTVRYDDWQETETFLLGTRDGATDDVTVYSPESPIGRALYQAKPGERRSYCVPGGATVTVTLLRSVPFDR